MATTIAITDLTNGTLDTNNEWNGTGVFDKLMVAVSKNIEGQYNKGRIRDTDYASVYLGAIQSIITESIKFLLTEKLQEAQIEKIEEEIDLLQTQDSELQLNGVSEREIKTSQKNLYNRQEQGFDDNLNLKLFEAQLDVYGMAWSSVGGFGTADDTALPAAFNGTNITALYNSIKPA